MVETESDATAAERPRSVIALALGPALALAMLALSPGDDPQIARMAAGRGLGWRRGG